MDISWKLLTGCPKAGFNPAQISHVISEKQKVPSSDMLRGRQNQKASGRSTLICCLVPRFTVRHGLNPTCPTVSASQSEIFKDRFNDCSFWITEARPCSMFRVRFLSFTEQAPKSSLSLLSCFLEECLDYRNHQLASGEGRESLNVATTSEILFNREM